MSWTPPSTLQEKIKRALFSPRHELKRIVARELRKGEPELRLLPSPSFSSPARTVAAPGPAIM